VLSRSSSAFAARAFRRGHADRGEPFIYDRCLAGPEMSRLNAQSLMSAIVRRLPAPLRRRIRDWREREHVREVDARLAPMQVLCGPLTCKRVLDLGCDSGFTIRRCMALGAREALGLNPGVKPRELEPSCRIEQRDAARTGLPADAYDLAVSFAAFEHSRSCPTCSPRRSASCGRADCCTRISARSGPVPTGITSGSITGVGATTT